MTASAGFGCFYAWHTGSQHGPILGALTVVFALGLEFAKPLAISAAFDALRQFRVFTALAMLLLGALAVTYSLAAELSLMAGARGDVIAKRKADGDKARDARGDRDRIIGELASLGITRPAATIEAELNAILTDKRLNDCSGWLANVQLRAVCIERVAPLKAELGKAERAAVLRSQLSASGAGSSTVEKQADPAAHALSVYLTALGIVVAAGTLSEWLVLIPVLALELGSALALVLVQAARTPAQSADPKPSAEVTEKPADPAPTATVQPTVQPPAQCGTDKARQKVLDMIAQAGGTVQSGQRTMAERAGVSTTRLRQVLDGLTAEGVVKVRAGSTATTVQLVSAGQLVTV